MGHNSYDAEKLEAFSKRIHNLLDEKERTAAEYMSDVKETYREASKETGIPVKAFREIMAEQRAEMKREKRLAEWSEEERSEYEQARDALGQLEGTPLGDAALGDSEKASASTPAA